MDTCINSLHVRIQLSKYTLPRCFATTYGEDDYPPVYNYIEVDIKDSRLLVTINSRKWDGSKFVKYDDECKSYSLSLVKENLWNTEDKENVKKFFL